MVVEADFGTSPKGLKQVGAVFEIRRGPLEGQRLSWWGYLNTRDNAERAVRVMKTCGWDGRSVDTMRRNEVEIVVRHEIYEGRRRARVAFVNEVRGLTMKQPMTEQEKTDLQAKLAAFARDLGLREVGVAGTTTDGAGESYDLTPEPEVNESDVPF
jgi:hypothetical protein